MNVPFSYQEVPVPETVKPFVRRIMVAHHEGSDAVTIPARPTGQCYIGWMPQGRGTARANGEAFLIDASSYHLSGQLTTFEADYTLHGPAQHYLAECTATGAYRLLKQDIGALRNKVAIFPFENDSGQPEAAFAKVLERLARHAGAEDMLITQIATQIEKADGIISIKALASDHGMSVRQLHRQFTRIVGMPPKAFAMVKRVLFALQQLSVQDRPDIAEVALDAGFTDQAHLTKYFNLYMRTTPARLELNDDGVLKSVVAKV